MLPVSSRLKIITLLLLLLTLLLAPQLAADVEAGYVPDPSHWPAECVIPDSGPWPPCATGGETAPPANGDCVIPATGPWPSCATGGQTPSNGGECVIPASGPWPPCATNSNPSPPGSGGGCVIPASGPWPPCATGGGGGNTPNAEPTLVSFSADKTWLGHGEGVKLRWNVANTERVSLRPLNSLQTLHTISGLPSVGSYDFDTGWLCDGDGEVEFELLVTQNNKFRVIGSLKIASQKNGWFFTLSDGTNPASQPCNLADTSVAAIQSFENGYMLWLADTDGIFVMLNGEGSFPATWQGVQNTFVEGMPESDPALVPPDGLHQPIRGFGKLWRESLEIRESLGWATNPEVGFIATYQSYNSCVATRCSYATYISDPSGTMLWHLQDSGSGEYALSWWLKPFTWAK